MVFHLFPTPLLRKDIKYPLPILMSHSILKGMEFGVLSGAIAGIAVNTYKTFIQ